MKMIGKTSISFETVYDKQIEFQKKLTEKIKGKKINLPLDDVNNFAYHVCAMIEELGEVLKVDKRWKTHRNTEFNSSEKLYELVDVFITVMNLCIFSGFNYNEVLFFVNEKINKNMVRLLEEDNERKK